MLDTQLIDMLPEELIQWRGNAIFSAAGHLQINAWQFQLASVPLTPLSFVLCWADTINKTMLTHILASLIDADSQVEIYPVTEVEGHQLLVLGASQEVDSLKSNFASLQLGCDVAVLEQLPDLRQPGLVVMDMDSTTIQIECIDEIAKLAGVGQQVSEVTLAAMHGKLDFEQSLRSRVALLEQAPENILQQVADDMPLMPGLEILIDTLKAANWQVMIASGGFTYFAKRLQNLLGFDAVFANELEIVGGKLTGRVLGGVVDAQRKADILRIESERLGIVRSQTIAIGDGANDLKMMTVAGLGIAIHAKPLVQEQAQMAIHHSSLDGVVCVLRAGQQRHQNWT